MKDKIKVFSKKYLIGFTLGLISGSLVMVYAETYFPSNQTTYDNSASGLSSTNVQGAIDELYTTCFPPTGGDSILEKEPIVTSGDGLYEDEYEEGKYTYKGANPNNYVTFNNEIAGWRIISINSDGTIKIMRDASIGNRAWDSSSSNNWNRPATLNTYLNGTYYNNLTSTAQSQTTTATYYAGAISLNDNNMQSQINDEKSTISQVKVALPTASEYIRACSNKSCKTFSTFNDNYSTCKNSDWMYASSISAWWILAPYSSFSHNVLFVSSYGSIGDTLDASYSASVSIAIRPAITLSSEVKITGGDGSKSNPYTIE